MKDVHLRTNVDMSPEAIDRRLRDVGQLYRLGISLSKARCLGRTEDLRRQEAEAKKKSLSESNPDGMLTVDAVLDSEPEGGRPT